VKQWFLKPSRKHEISTIHGFGHDKENICMLQIINATFNASSYYASKEIMAKNLVVMGE
jgi:hypothetical protein